MNHNENLPITALMFPPDFERVITHHIQHENYTDALEKLKKQVCILIIWLCVLSPVPLIVA